MEPIGKEGEFRRRVKEIYASIHDAIRHGRFYHVDQTTLDGRAGLVRSMFHTFLGRDFDASKRTQVEALQAALRARHEELASKLSIGSLAAEDYLILLNREIEATLQKCEEVLGARDFRELFGAAPETAAGLIDSEVFLKSRGR